MGKRVELIGVVKSDDVWLNEPLSKSIRTRFRFEQIEPEN